MVKIPGRSTDWNTAGYAEYVENLEKAFSIACNKLSDSPQSYEEANTPDGWAKFFMDRAKMVSVFNA